MLEVMLEVKLMLEVVRNLGVEINATGTKAAVEANSIITLYSYSVEIRKKFLACRQYKLRDVDQVE